MLVVLIFFVFFVLMAIRVPLAYSMLASTSLYFLIVGDEARGLYLQRIVGSLESFPLIAVPLFVLAGTAMAYGGIADRLMAFLNTLVGHWRGGLAQVNVLNSFLIGGMSGTATADAAIDARVLVPVMKRNGYSTEFAAALSAASSAIAPMLPPSLLLILYGVYAETSISGLFIAGIVPAVVTGVVLSVVVYAIAVRRGYGATRPSRAKFREVLSTGWRSVFALGMPLILLLGLRAGVFTPTELAAAAAVYALVVGLFIYRDIPLRKLRHVLVESARLTGVLMLLVAAGLSFSIMISLERVPDVIGGWIVAFSENPLIFLLLVNVMLLILGLAIEPLTLLIILAPILAPIASQFDIDPLQFGVVIVLNLTLGAMSPPSGGIIFAVVQITRVPMDKFVRELLPLFGALVGVLLLISYVPALSTWLPGLWQ